MNCHNCGGNCSSLLPTGVKGQAIIKSRPQCRWLKTEAHGVVVVLAAKTGMIGRYTRLSDSWKKYGARGIKICERWLNYENFLAGLGRKPTLRLHDLHRRR